MCITMVRLVKPLSEVSQNDETPPSVPGIPVLVGQRKYGDTCQAPVKDQS
jgi:hypothetical protein